MRLRYEQIEPHQLLVAPPLAKNQVPPCLFFRIQMDTLRTAKVSKNNVQLSLINACFPHRKHGCTAMF